MKNGIVFLAYLVVLFAGKVVYLRKIKIKYLKKRVSEEIFVYALPISEKFCILQSEDEQSMFVR